MKTVISEDQARLEIEGWLEFRKVSENQRKANEDSEQTLIEAIMDGSLLVETNNSLTYSLAWPLDDGAGVKSLTFKPRMTTGDKMNAVKGVAAKDGDGRLVAYIAALTDQPQGVIKKLEAGRDSNVAMAIVSYFL